MLSINKSRELENHYFSGNFLLFLYSVLNSTFPQSWTFILMKLMVMKYNFYFGKNLVWRYCSLCMYGYYVNYHEILENGIEL